MRGRQAAPLRRAQQHKAATARGAEQRLERDANYSNGRRRRRQIELENNGQFRFGVYLDERESEFADWRAAAFRSSFVFAAESVCGGGGGGAITLAGGRPPPDDSAGARPLPARAKNN